MHYAHSTATPDGSDWQPLRDHLKQTALKAEMFGSKFGAAKAAALAGWLPDLGKYSQAYQAISEDAVWAGSIIRPPARRRC